MSKAYITSTISRRQQGSILILVVGLSALLLSTAVAVIASQRAMEGSSVIAHQEATNRVQLTNALFYLQERSVIGWGDGPGEHSYGWVDVRDGAIGPRGPHSGTPADISSGAEWRANQLAAGEQSESGPAQWTAGTWPAPGTTLRGDTFTWQTPPYAIRQEIAPNPVTIPEAMRGRDSWGPIIGGWRRTGDSRSDEFSPFWMEAFRNIAQNHNYGYPVQAVADSLSDAADRTKLTVDRLSVGRGWFRIYREEKDADGFVVGGAWYDSVPIAGHGTFIVTVGSGATRGYRFWDATTDYLGGRTTLPSGIAALSSAIEPETASASGLFTEATFRAARQNERISWYRVHWVAQSSSGYDAFITTSIGRGRSQGNYYLGALTRMEDQPNDFHLLPHQGGAIRMIQRLDREPPKW